MATVTPFQTILADPPWQYRDGVGPGIGFGADRIRGRRGAAGYYPTMGVGEICALGAADGSIAGHAIADNAHLYLWTTNAFMVEGHQVCVAWGFQPRTILTWVKPRIGMGWHFRNTTEHVIFAVRGSLRTQHRDVRTDFVGPVSRHSQKPEEIFRIVERQSPGPRLELFARQARAGWTCAGNDLSEAQQGDQVSLVCGPRTLDGLTITRPASEDIVEWPE